MTVPEGVSRLWLIVTPAPKKYVAHKWTESMTNAEHWPYRFRLEGTDLTANATVYDNPTAIKSVTGNTNNHSKGIYNLKGQKTATTATHSLYIVDGKKVIL